MSKGRDSVADALELLEEASRAFEKGMLMPKLFNHPGMVELESVEGGEERRVSASDDG